MSDQSVAMLDRVQGAIHAHHMLSPSDRILVAVSGGPDSIALLHLLRALHYDIVVAHLDHLTRNGESTEDAAFVEKLARGLNLPFVSEQRSVESNAAGSRESFEQTARMARYVFFGNVAHAHDCSAIATGHNADDVAETVLWRMLRGTSVDGIAGIPPVRLLDGARIVRPLIACTRNEIEDYLSSEAIPFRTDSSNEDRRFLRNRIRHELLPLLQREYNPKVNEALVRLAALARDDATVMAELLEPFLDACETDDGIDRKQFAEAPNASEALQRRAIHTFAQRHGIDPSFERTEAARHFILSGRTGAQLDLGGGAIINTRTSTRFLRADGPEQSVELSVPGETIAFGMRFVARILERRPAVPWSTYCTPSRQVFDADILGNTVCIRARSDGDRFTPLGMKGTRKLQDYFVDTGIPRDERDHIPIVEAGGKVAWIVGGAVDAQFAVQETAENLVELEVTDAAQ